MVSRKKIVRWKRAVTLGKQNTNTTILRHRSVEHVVATRCAAHHHPGEDLKP